MTCQHTNFSGFPSVGCVVRSNSTSSVFDSRAWFLQTGIGTQSWKDIFLHVMLKQMDQVLGLTWVAVLKSATPLNWDFPAPCPLPAPPCHQNSSKIDGNRQPVSRQNPFSKTSSHQVTLPLFSLLRGMSIHGGSQKTWMPFTPGMPFTIHPWHPVLVVSQSQVVCPFYWFCFASLFTSLALWLVEGSNLYALATGLFIFSLLLFKPLQSTLTLPQRWVQLFLLLQQNRQDWVLYK